MSSTDQPTAGRTCMKRNCLGPLIKYRFLGPSLDLPELDTGGVVVFHGV